VPGYHPQIVLTLIAALWIAVYLTVAYSDGRDD
jgi:hypothetical protein